MHRLHRIAIAWLLIGASSPPARAADVPRPEAHLGFRPGADFRLADWPTVMAYFQRVDAASDRVQVRELGRTTEGRPYLVAIVSRPETIAELARYQDLQHRLTDPRFDAATAEGRDPVAASKAVVVITCSIHSTETASTLMAMELLHELATRDDPSAREVLEKTILLLVPSANPDGVDKVAHWYERSKGHPWEGSGMVELYHKYAGHDTNRDWFMLNLKETQLLTRLLYKEWFPTILYDVHQMGERSARLFVPPFYDPINSNLDPRLNQAIFLIGAHMAADLAAAGKRGVLTNAIYDNYWNGGNRTTPQRHNIVGVLTEAASVRLATPVFLKMDDLRADSRGFTQYREAVNFVDPWPGGWWRLRDIVDYELICARSVLTLAARYKDQFQSNLRDMGRDAVAQGRRAPPFAWIVPRDQRDPGTAAEMVRILHDTGIEVRRARSSFQAEGITYPADSWILPAAQPYRAHLKDMMERQVYPERFTVKGEAEPPYDVAGWTLPLQMGVRAVTVAQPFEAVTDALDAIEPIRGRIEGPPSAAYLAIRNQSNDDFIVINALLEAGLEVWTVPFTFNLDADSPARGTVWFADDEKSRRVLHRVLPSVSTRVTAESGDRNRAQSSRISARRIGVYQPWMPNMDEGWTRLVLEKFHFPYVTLHNAEICAGDLRGRVDTLLLPSIDAKEIRSGYAAHETEPAYAGGLGAEGAKALRAFVQEGGTLVSLEDSCEYAIEELGLPVKNVLKGLKTLEFYAPGSIVRIVDQPDYPHVPPGRFNDLTLGMPGEASAFFNQSLAFDVPPYKADAEFPCAVAIRYAADHVLESGWLLGPEKIAGKAAVVDVQYGRGRIVLFGFPPQHRGQPHGTFRLLFNALYLGG